MKEMEKRKNWVCIIWKVTALKQNLSNFSFEFPFVSLSLKYYLFQILEPS